MVLPLSIQIFLVLRAALQWAESTKQPLPLTDVDVYHLLSFYDSF